MKSIISPAKKMNVDVDSLPWQDLPAFLDRTEQLLQLLDGLPPKEKQVLKLRFGMDGSPVMTLEDVGSMLNCTSERVRQIQNQALKRLHKQMMENA